VLSLAAIQMLLGGGPCQLDMGPEVIRMIRLKTNQLVNGVIRKHMTSDLWSLWQDQL